MSQQGYQSDAQGAGFTINTLEDLFIGPGQFNPRAIELVSNGYNVINGNLIVNRNIQFLSRDPSRIDELIFNLPAPLHDPSKKALPLGTIHSSDGDVVGYSIQADGRVFMNGSFANESPGIITFQFNPYLAELPLRYAPDIVIF